MQAIVLGEGAVFTLRELSLRLKEKTCEVARRLDNQDQCSYSPWLSLRPAIEQPIDSSILSVKSNGGDLVADRDQLSAIGHFLREQGKILTEGMPVKADEWPVMVNIETERPDAIAAFREGRALLRSSSFLDDLYKDLVDLVVPLDRERPSGFDTAFARGVVFRTFPKGSGGLLAGFQLAHAMGHQAAIVLQSADPIIESSPDAEIFWLVRRDQRSAIHAFVSAVALGYMVILSHSIYGRNSRPFIAEDHVRGYAEYLPNAVQQAVESISVACKMTPLGDEVLKELLSLAS